MKKGFLQLQRRTWWLLIISGIFSLSVALSNTFVNVYLWKVDKTYGSIGVYNLYLYIMIPITFILAGFLASRKTAVWPLRIGIISHVVFYALTLFGGTAIAQLPYVLGIVMGFAAGMYWFAFNQLSLEFTGHGERDKFFGLNGVMGAIAGMVAPPVAGFLISKEDRFGPVSGYHVIFALSLGLFVAATFVTLRVKSEPVDRPLQFHVAADALKRRWWRFLMVGCAVYGMREGVFMFLIGLLIYVATGSEMRLGEFVLLQSALSFVSFYIVGRIVKPSNRLKMLGVGAVCMAGAALFFLMPIRPLIVILYGSVIALVIPLFLVSLQGFVFDGISTLSGRGEQASEHIITREVFENAGRVVGIAAFLWLSRISPSEWFVPKLAVGLGFVQLFTWMLLRSSGIQDLTRDAHDGEKAEARPPIRLKARKVWTMQNEEASRPPRGSKSVFRRSPP